MGHQVGIHLRHLLSDKAELRDGSLIQLGLLVESDGTQGQERLTDKTHVGTVCLKVACGGKHPQLPVIVHVTGASARPDGLARDAANVGGCMQARSPDANGTALGIEPTVPDANVVIARCEVASGGVTERNIVMTGRVAGKGDRTNGRVLGARRVA